MGADTYINVHYGTDTQTDAFDLLHRQAQHENGYGGYTGTIADAHGTVLADNPHGRPLSLIEARKFAHKALRTHIEKGGPALALPLVRETDEPELITKTVTITLPGPLRPYYDSEAEGYDEFHEALKTACKLTAGQFINTVTAEDIKTKATVKATATQGKTATRYFALMPDEKSKYDFAANWAKGHPTQAAARAAAVEALKTSTASAGDVTMVVVAHTLREDAAALVTVTRSIVSTTATVRVTIGNAPKPDAQQGGWLFYGVAPR